MLLEQSRAEQSRAEQSRAGRIEWIDIAKGIAIICVILGHLGISKINRVVFVFHMPLFFFLSGYFISRKDSFVQFVKTKARTLLIPYLSTCVLMCVFGALKAFYLNKNAISAAWKWFAGGLYGAGFYPEHTLFNIPVFIGALWFLWALFWGLLITRRTLDKAKPDYHFLLISCIAWIGYQTSVNIWLPIDIQAGMTASLFIYIGYYSRVKNVLLSKMDLELLLLSVFVVIWCMKYFKGFWMVSNSYCNGMMDIFGALASIYLLRYFCDYIKKFNRVSSLLKWYGSNSIVILCFHILELNLFPWHLLLPDLQFRMLFIAVTKIIFASACVFMVNKCYLLRFLFKGKLVKL